MFFMFITRGVKAITSGHVDFEPGSGMPTFKSGPSRFADSPYAVGRMVEVGPVVQKNGAWGQELTVELENLGKQPFRKVDLTIWRFYEPKGVVAKEYQEGMTLNSTMKWLDKKLIRAFVSQPSQDAVAYRYGSVRSVSAAPLK